MADYQPLIAKAVAGLERNTGEARRSLYERARTALVAQLRGVQPPLSESDITRERLALEEAIRKVEAESARKSRYETPPRAEAPQRSEARAPERAPPPSPAPMEPTRGEDERPESQQPHPYQSQPQPRPDNGLPSGPSSTAAELRRARPKPPPDRGSLSDEGLKGFRDVVAEAENLGEATAQAGKTAREAFAAVPSPPAGPGQEFERREPHIEPEGLRPRPARPAPPPPSPPPIARGREAGLGEDVGRLREPAAPPMARPRGMPSQDLDRGHDTGPPRERPRPEPAAGMGMGPAAGMKPSPADDFTGDDFSPYMDRFDGHPHADPAQEERPPRGAFGRATGTSAAAVARLRPRGGLLKLAVVALVAAAAVALIVWQRQPIVAMVSSLSSMFSSAPAPTPREATPSRAKIADRVGDAATQRNANAPAVAQRVVLYEEDPADPAGKQYVGTAVWRNETISPGPGQAPEMAVRADIEIPDRKITMRWSLRRNTDAALPASHTIEIMFNLPPDFAHGGVQSIPGILMKQSEQTRGVPLAGLAVKVTTNFFLIGLSAVDTDQQRNVALLKDRGWFDVPVVYNDGRRAILAVEKGNPGDRAFQDAFSAWAAKGK